MMIVNGPNKYFRAPFNNEAEIETVVRDYAEYLFGSNIVFVPKSKIETLGGIGTIPDGFVLDLESEEWFMVEAELASHGTWQHIAPQISKQLAAVDSQATRDSILGIALDLEKTHKEVANVFADLGVLQIDVHGKLQGILKKAPTIAIPIDGVPSDLQSWAKTLKFKVKKIPPEGIRLETALGDLEKTLLMEALEMSRGNKDKTAELLNVTIRSLRYRLQKFNLGYNWRPGN